MNIQKKFFILNILLTFFFASSISEDFPIFITSIPKCGTHLIFKCLNLLTNKIYIDPVAIKLPKSTYNWINDNTLEYVIRNNGICITHLYPIVDNIEILRKYRSKGFFIYRDPRDQLISYSLWIYTLSNIYPQYKDIPLNNLMLKLIINIKVFYNTWLPWKNESIIYTTTFEKLIGPKGGGNLEEQLTEIKNIANHIGLDINDERAKEISDKLFGANDNTPTTFREGQIGSWKKHFTQEHKTLFKEVAGQLLIDLGYENDLNW